MGAPRPVHFAKCIDNVEAAREQRLLTLDGSTLTGRYTIPGQVIEAESGSGRAYFVVSSPLEAWPRFQILVRLGAGAVAEEIGATAADARLAVTDPFGPGFPLPPARDRQVVVCVTGTGVGAARPLLYALAAERGSLAGVELFYGVRTPGHVAFGEEIEAFARRGMLLRLCLSDTAPSGASDRPGWVQRVVSEERKDLSGAVVYVAGHREMTKELREICAGAGLPAASFLSNF